MNLNATVFDLWVFHQDDDLTKYLLFYSSQEKADKWFNGVQFWQILSDFFQDEEDVTTALLRLLQKYDLREKSLWAVEHSYTFYNRRFKEIQICTVYAAEVEKPADIQLTSGHSKYDWFTAEECRKRLNYRGLIEGLEWTRKYITESTKSIKELQLL